MLDRVAALSTVQHSVAAEDIRVLNDVLRLVAKHRAHLLQNTILKELGPTVYAGPFRGMQFVSEVTEGCYVPKLLGCYEAELHEHWESLIRRGYGHVVNVGCAEGYYAVGLAHRLPLARVHAFDIDPRGQQTCRSLADQNGVGERVSVGAEFRLKDFRDYPPGDTLVLCDIEGAELELLDPVAEPSLKQLDLVVELHPHRSASLPEEVLARFADSHEITRVSHQQQTVELPDLFDRLGLGHLDRLLSLWSGA